jgi:hypothetical protein
MNVEKIDYYVSKVPKELDSMIFATLYNKNYCQSLTHSDSLMTTWDGDYFCMIYKFEGQSERIITYVPPNLTDSLVVFHAYLESLIKKSNNYPTKPFDIDQYIKKYKNIIIDDNPLAPPLSKDTIFIYYKNPNPS